MTATRRPAEWVNKATNPSKCLAALFLIFVNFITENETLKNYISDKITDVEYDFEKCFDMGCSGWADYKPPKDEACHIKAAYDYLLFINENDKANVRGQSMRYCWSSRKINDNIQSFIDMAFKPLIDYINDQLSMDMIVLDEEGKTVGGNTFIQQIGTVNGSANQQVSGVINSYNTNNDAVEILALISILFRMGSISRSAELKTWLRITPKPPINLTVDTGISISILIVWTIPLRLRSSENWLKTFIPMNT